MQVVLETTVDADTLWNSLYGVAAKDPLKQKFLAFLEQTNNKNSESLKERFECWLIDNGTYDQASAMLRQTLTPAQKAALKKVIRESGKLDVYEGRNDDGDEIWVEHGIDVDALISALTGDEV